jgi:outer membrane biosynthesis protein TonB
VEEKVRQMRQQAHQQLQAAVHRINACDELLGERTLEAAFLPFEIEPSDLPQPAALPPAQDEEPEPEPEPPAPAPKPRAKSKAKPKPRTSSGPKPKVRPAEKRLSLGQIMRKVLEANPDKLMRKPDIKAATKELGLGNFDTRAISNILYSLARENKAPWMDVIRVKGKSGGRPQIWYRLASSHGGRAPSHPEGEEKHPG